MQPDDTSSQDFNDEEKLQKLPEDNDTPAAPAAPGNTVDDQRPMTADDDQRNDSDDEFSDRYHDGGHSQDRLPRNGGIVGYDPDADERNAA